MNILSLNKIVENDHTVKFKHGCKIMNTKASWKATGTVKNGVYKLK